MSVRRLRHVAASLTGVAVAIGAMGIGVVAGTSVAGAASSSPIKIGLAAATTGTEEQIMPATVSVAKAWAAYTNANGGIGGHKVQIISENTEGVPATMLSDVETMVNSQHVVAVMMADDVATTAATTFLATNNIPVIGVMGFSTAWGQDPNFFPVFTQIPSTILGQLNAAVISTTKKFGAVVCEEVAACLQVATLFKPEAKALGMTFAGVTTAAASSPNYTSQCLTLIQDGATFISMNIQVSEHNKFVTDCIQQGFKGTFGTDANGFDTATTDVKGAKFAGNASEFPFWSNAKPVKAFRAAMAKYAKGVTYRNGEAPAAWSELQLFKLALGKAKGKVTTSTVLSDYYKLKTVTLTGLLPQPVSFTKGQPPTNIRCYWLFKWTVTKTKTPVSVQPPSGTTTGNNGMTNTLATTCATTKGL